MRFRLVEAQSWDKDTLEKELMRLTNDLKKNSGSIKGYIKDELDYAKKFLRKYYTIVETSDLDDGSAQIEFHGLKKNITEAKIAGMRFRLVEDNESKYLYKYVIYFNDDTKQEIEKTFREENHLKDSIREAFNMIDEDETINYVMLYNEFGDLIRTFVSPNGKTRSLSGEYMPLYIHYDDGDFYSESLKEDKIADKIRANQDIQGMTATEVVRWMYNEFPEWAFYNENELNDGRIMLYFEIGPKHQREDLEDALDEVGLIGVFRGRSLIIIAKEDDILEEDTVKTKSGKWTNRGDTGETHGEFRTKKEADAQRRAIYASGWKGRK